MLVKSVIFILAVTIVIVLVRKVLIPAFDEEAPDEKLNHIEKFDKAFQTLKDSVIEMEEVIEEVSSAEKDALKFAEDAANTIKHGKKIIKQVNKIKEEKGEE